MTTLQGKEENEYNFIAVWVKGQGLAYIGKVLH